MIGHFSRRDAFHRGGSHIVAHEPKNVHLLYPQWIRWQLAVRTVLGVEVTVGRPTEIDTQSLLHLVTTSSQLFLGLGEFLIPTATALSVVAERLLKHTTDLLVSLRNCHVISLLRRVPVPFSQVLRLCITRTVT